MTAVLVSLAILALVALVVAVVAYRRTNRTIAALGLDPEERRTVEERVARIELIAAMYEAERRARRRSLGRTA